MKKTLAFRERDILSIEITYPPSDELGDKKVCEFCDVVTRAFLKFCERKLYKNASELFLLSEQSQQSNPEDEEFIPFTAFSARMDLGAERGAFGISNVQTNTKIHLDIDINGEKRHKIYSLTNIIVKKKKTKSEEQIFETNYLR